MSGAARFEKPSRAPDRCFECSRVCSMRRGAMSAADDLLSAAANVARVGICCIDEAGLFARANPMFCELSRFSLEELIGFPWTIAAPPEIVAIAPRFLAEIFAESHKISPEWRIRRKDGSQFPAMVSFRTLTRDDGKRFAVVTFVDVSEQQRAHVEIERLNRELEQRVSQRTTELSNAVNELRATVAELTATRDRLEASETRLSQLITTARDAVIMMDGNGLVTEWNAQAEVDFGWTRAEAVGARLSDLVIPESLRGAHEQGLRRAAQTGTGKMLNARVDINAINKRGEEFPVEMTVWPLRTAQGIQFGAFIRNQSERLQSAALRRRLEEDLANTLLERERILDTSVMGIILVDIGNRVKWINRTMVQLFGYTVEEILGRSTSMAYPTHEDYQAMTAEAAPKLLGGEPYETETRMKRRTGEVFWAHVSGRSVNPHSLEQGTVWTVRDITLRKGLEARVAQAHTERELILQTSQTGIAFLRERRHVWVNAKYAEMTGRPAETLIGAPSEIVHESVAAYESLLERAVPVLHVGESFVAEYPLRRPDGRRVWCHIAVRAVDRNDRSKGSIWTFADITAQRIAQEGQQRLAAILERTTDMVMIADERTNLTYMNRAGREVLSIPADEELSGSTLFDHFPPDSSRRQYDTAIARMRRTGVVNGELELFSRDQRRIPVSIVAIAHRGPQGEVEYFSGIARDISARRRVEEEMRRALARERELGEMKSRFVAMASHEFRTPLATVLSSVELLQRYRDKVSATDQAEMLEDIGAAARRIQAMVDDVLVLGRAESGRLECKRAPVDIERLCRIVMTEVARNLTKPVPVDLKVAGADRTMRVDESLLRHILVNLLGNAIKYSPAQASVGFEVNVGGDAVVFRVRDRGIGIPEEDLPKLFESFFRARNVGNIGGTGTVNLFSLRDHSV